MIALFDTYDAEDDLRQLEERGFSNDASLLIAFMDQIEDSEEARWSLIKYRAEHPDPLFNVKAIDFLQAKGYNIYRIRPLRLVSAYRIIYAYDNEVDEVHVLAYTRKRDPNAPKAIEHIHYDYEHDHPLSQRFCDEYDRLGIPKIARRT